jgi:hypothetical protein
MAELTREGQKERIERIQAIKKSLAERDNTKVVFSRTRDTSGLLLLVQSGDLAINRLRGGLGIDYDFKAASDAIEGYKNAIVELARQVKKVCDMTKVDFRAPKWVREPLGLGEEEHDTKKK